MYLLNQLRLPPNSPIHTRR